jgi:hypothetical protein
MTTVSSETAFLTPRQAEDDDSIERSGSSFASRSRKHRQYRAKRPFSCFQHPNLTTISSETAFDVPQQAKNDDSIE